MTADDAGGSEATVVERLPDRSGRVTVESAVEGTDVPDATTYEDDACYDVIVEFDGEDLIHWQNLSSDACALKTTTA